MQMSESYITAALICVSGGLQDAYTYFARGHVYANAQTGNIINLAKNLYERQWTECIQYAVPVLFFVGGTLFCELLHRKKPFSKKLHWRQVVVLIEILILFSVAFISEEENLLANSLVSFSCAMQIEAFKTVHHRPFNSAMCITNLRNASLSLYRYYADADKEALWKSLCCFSMILLFALGAVAGTCLLDRLGLMTIFASCFLLTVTFLIMFVDEFPVL